MATIASTTNQLRHVRKTFTFTGASGFGLNAVACTLFAITGRVLVHHFTGFCTTGLSESGATSTSSIGVASDTGIFSFGTFNSVDIDTNEWMENDGGVGGVAGAGLDLRKSTKPQAVSENIIWTPGGGVNITGGVVVMDIWYLPITDDGALAGDDIDAGYTPADVKAWLATAAATPTVAGIPEVDVTHFGGTAGTFAAGIPEAKVASIAAAAITAAAVATGAIDADALATDAVTELVTALLTTQMTESYNADGAAPTLAQALFLLISALTEFAISGTTVTAKKLDGSTTAATYTLNSATAPTSRTRAT